MCIRDRPAPPRPTVRIQWVVVAPVGRAFGRRSPLATLAVGLGELVALGAAEVSGAAPKAAWSRHSATRSSCNPQPEPTTPNPGSAALRRELSPATNLDFRTSPVPNVCAASCL